VSVLLLTFGCRDDRFEEDQTLGGVRISKEVLNQGMGIYRRTCAGCHGVEGLGRRQVVRNEKPPRNLTSGYYKFTSVEGDGLPLDSDLNRIIRLGVRGTQMSGYPDLTTEEVSAVSHYIKTFSERWRNEEAGQPVPVRPDPWVGKRPAATARGEAVYHAVARCWTCHPSYLSENEIRTLVARYSPEEPLRLRESLRQSYRTETKYGMVLPPDFLSVTLPAARGLDGLYRAISAGIGGTPMPTWHERLSTSDIWALVHYVRELVRLRGTPRATLVRAGMLRFGSQVSE